MSIYFIRYGDAGAIKIGNGECTIGHKLTPSLVACENCGCIITAPESVGMHVNGRNKQTVLEHLGMKWLPYTVADWQKIIAGEWDHSKYPNQI